jgi:hypothetical protein
MFRTHRTLLLAALLLTAALAVAPAPAICRTIFTCGHTQVGTGRTVAEAKADALARLQASYYVSSYSFNYAFCLEGEDAEQVPESLRCLAEVNACVFPKPIIRH